MQVRSGIMPTATCSPQNGSERFRRHLTTTTGRICCAVELEPRYCDIAVARWEPMTESEALLR